MLMKVMLFTASRGIGGSWSGQWLGAGLVGAQLRWVKRFIHAKLRWCAKLIETDLHDPKRWYTGEIPFRGKFRHAKQCAEVWGWTWKPQKKWVAVLVNVDNR